MKLAHPVFISDTFIYQRESSENATIKYIHEISQNITLKNYTFANNKYFFSFAV